MASVHPETLIYLCYFVHQNTLSFMSEILGILNVLHQIQMWWWFRYKFKTQNLRFLRTSLLYKQRWIRCPKSHLKYSKIMLLFSLVFIYCTQNGQFPHIFMISSTVSYWIFFCFLFYNSILFNKCVLKCTNKSDLIPILCSWDRK